MARKDVVVRVAGEGGEGVISVAEILTRSAADSGLEVFTFRTYPAEIRGGLAMMQVRISTEALSSIGMRADVLMAFNQEGFDVWGQSMTPEGVVLYDPKHCEIPEDYPHRSIPLPIHDTSMQETGSRVSKNIVSLAALVSALDIPPQFARDLFVKKFTRKGQEVVDKNLKAYAAGLTLLESHALDEMRLERAASSPRADRIIMSGNQATSMGALAAGCEFVAGYPITPATPVLEFMMKHLPGLGGTVVQAEDEIASIAMCLGASYSGAKAMTATSGPGLALMSELIGMASMSEIPVVLVDVMRSGPGTGMPTKTEQADLMYALHGTPGEAPRIVIAATSIEDCFHQMVSAFNLAERYQMPVIVLTDQSMAYRTKTVDIPDLDAIEVVRREAPSAAQLEDYRRYLDTKSGVSPVSRPGTPGGTFVSSGLEHDETGAPNYTPENRAKMTAKRYRKLGTLTSELEANGNGRCDDGGGATIGVVGWGSTEGPIQEAIRVAGASGTRIAHLHPKVLMPLSTKKVEEFLKPLKKVIVFEENHTAQFSKHLRASVDFGNTEIVDVNQCSGLPFAMDDVSAELEKHV
jgi:2-oxoglutarate ferredoxin oxidoreductase subunit alpha